MSSAREEPCTTTPSMADSRRTSVSRSPYICAAFPASPSTASRAALADPTIRGTFSVPDRKPCSWPPPASRGYSCSPSRLYSMPTPLGPRNLWAEKLTRPAFHLAGATGSLPKA
ncbi:hypothetical protein D3C76_1452240 [compost metagenome]